MFTLTIETENAAFEGDAAPDEVARILRELARAIQENGFAFPTGLRDVNGNRCGAWAWTEGAPPVLIDRDTLATLEGVASEFADDLASGTEDGTYDPPPGRLKEIRAACRIAQDLMSAEAR